MLQVDRAGRKCRQPSSELCSDLLGRTDEGQERVPGWGLSRGSWLCSLPWRARAGPTLGASPVDTGIERLEIISNKARGRGSDDVNASLRLSPAGS